MRNFIMNWKECRDKEDKMYCLGESQDSIISFVLFGSKKNKHYDDNKSRLYKIMSDEKFMKTCKRMCKKSALVELNPAFVAVILDFIENNKELDQEVAGSYMKIAKKAAANKLDELKKKVDLPESLLFAALGTMPDKDLVNNPKVMGRFINKALNRLYAYASAMDVDEVAEISTEELKVLMKKVFGKDAMCRVLVSIALEGQNTAEKLNDAGKMLYGKFTEFFLEDLSDYKKADIQDFFDLYIEQRKRAESYGRDYKRRIDFTALMESEKKYDRINNVLKDMEDSDEIKYLR